MNTKIVCVLACRSQDDLRQALRLAEAECDPNRVFVDVLVAFPGGVENRKTQLHRLGDYFERIELLTDANSESHAFKIMFQPQSGAGRYWKDIMNQIIHSLEKSGYVASSPSLYADV